MKDINNLSKEELDEVFSLLRPIGAKGKIVKAVVINGKVVG